MQLFVAMAHTLGFINLLCGHTDEHKVFTELGSADRDSPSCLVIPQTLPLSDWADVCGRV